jgi:LPS O-antigen subunit length determinant protein (WzzB/FepE family)
MHDTKNMMPGYLDGILRHWGKILLCGFTGILLGYIVYFILPVAWESEAVVQVGQVGQVGQVSQVGQRKQSSGLPVEDLQNVIERLKSPAFFRGISQKSGTPDFRNVLDSKHGGNGLLRVQKIRSSNINSNLILLKLRANTAELAKLKLDLIVKEITSLHYSLGRKYLDMLRTELADRQSRSNTLKEAVKEIDKRISGSDCFAKADSNIGKCSILLSSKLSANKTVLQNDKIILDLKIALSSPNTIPTSVLESPTLPIQPISIGLRQLLILGLLVGLALGIIWILVLRERNH